MRSPLAIAATRTRVAAFRRWRSARTTVLSYGAFGLLSAAAWTVSLPFGLAAAGLSLLIVEHLGGSATTGGHA
jgi:hypothetical protein